MDTSVKSFSFLLFDDASKPDLDVRRENFRDMCINTSNPSEHFLRTNDLFKKKRLRLKFYRFTIDWDHLCRLEKFQI